MRRAAGGIEWKRQSKNPSSSPIEISNCFARGCGISLYTCTDGADQAPKRGSNLFGVTHHISLEFEIEPQVEV